MRSYLSLELSHSNDLSSAFKADDIRYPESLVEHFLQEYTLVGDIVLDPFAGYGATLIVSILLAKSRFWMLRLQPNVA